MYIQRYINNELKDIELNYAELENAAREFLRSEIHDEVVESIKFEHDNNEFLKSMTNDIVDIAFDEIYWGDGTRVHNSEIIESIIESFEQEEYIGY